MKEEKKKRKKKPKGKGEFSGIIGVEEKKTNKKKKRKRRIGDFISLLIVLVALTVAGFSGNKLYTIFMEYKAGEDEYNSITEAVVTERDADEEEIRVMQEAEGVEEKHWTPPFNVDFDQLKSINSDVVGWLYMEALPNITYPIVKGKDNAYYLHRTYKKEDIFAGSIFIDYRNSGDFSDQNTIVYGHNMKNGSMFGTLKRYREPDLVKKSQYFWILTPDEAYKYKIYSIYIADAEGSTYTLIQGPGQSSLNYMETMKSKSEINLGNFDFTETDKTVTLSTCTGDSATRFVVQGVRIEPE